jgi:hypothetical protein
MRSRQEKMAGGSLEVLRDGHPAHITISDRLATFATSS